jgi:beta-N-acetylhexosaminidase
MSLEQKIGQMLLIGIDGTTLQAEAKNLIAKEHVGGIILYKNNISDLAGSVKLINSLKQANTNSDVPLLVSVDQEGGKVSRLPSEYTAMPDNAKVGKTGNPAKAKEMGALIAQELKLMGFNVDFAPVLDINSNPKNPVIGTRSFGGTASLVTKMGLAEVEGLRGGGIIPVVKHFPGHGDTSVDSHLDLPVVNKTTKQLQAMEWIPFKAAIDKQVEAVMVAHILFPKIDPNSPASISKVIIGKQLRGTLGYGGVVFTDDLTMGAIAKHYGIAEAAIRSVEAGGDILLVAHGYETERNVRDKLLQAVKSGRIKESRIDESVTRILKLKQKFNLSDMATPIPKTSDLPNAEVIRWVKSL